MDVTSYHSSVFFVFAFGVYFDSTMYFILIMAINIIFLYIKVHYLVFLPYYLPLFTIPSYVVNRLERS